MIIVVANFSFQMTPVTEPKVHSVYPRKAGAAVKLGGSL